MRRLFATDNVDEDYEGLGSALSDVYGSARQHIGDSHFGGSESMQASSVLSQSHERLGQSTDSPSFLSLVVVMSDGKLRIYFKLYLFYVRGKEFDILINTWISHLGFTSCSKRRTGQDDLPAPHVRVPIFHSSKASWSGMIRFILTCDTAPLKKLNIHV